MTKVLITESYLDTIADAIRGRNGTQNTYKPSEMAEAVTAIPNSYAAGDEGKVVSNGALVSQTARANAITANGEYDTTLNNNVTVNVSGGGGGDIPLVSAANWDALTDAQKQAYGLVAIQDTNSGYRRGILVYGGDYAPSIAYLPNSDPTLVKCIATWDNFSPSSLSWGDGETPIQMASACTRYQSEDAVFFNAKTAANAIGFDLGGETSNFTVYAVVKGIDYVSGDRFVLGSVYSWSAGMLIMIYHRSGTTWRSSIYGSDADLVDTHGDYVAIAIRSSSMNASWFAYGAWPRLNVAYNRHSQRFTFGGYANNYEADLAVKFVGYIAGAESDADISANLANLASVYGLI